MSYIDFNDHPERIYNMDKAGMPLDPRPPKVVAPKGQKKKASGCSALVPAGFMKTVLKM